ncbi:MAG: hypothetical protein KatS3mg078_0314 [Deltaproteobacteria bacterium]|jgi:hypothetical protein|nr:MAG: hypothetical protein KatS3mg078_0314 [Deltaproteobacteria bacterium]
MPRKSMPDFMELINPLPWYSPKRWYYGFFSAFLRTVGRLSEGIRIGYTYGFDSGMIMNYVYENTPRGRFYIGRFIDRIFLDQITCKAFRSIKQIQKDMIKKYLEERDGKPTFIVDLASGKADYIYCALKEVEGANVRVLLRDIDEKALRESRVIAERLGLVDRIKYEVGDALDPQSLKEIYPRPNLVVEVGLYGIIHEDELIRKHLHHVRNILNPDALLFNVQTYNPQIELIARVLTNQKGERCIWHLRPVDRVVGWAREAGFENPEITMDPYGIYAVVMMRGTEA